jgi:hypothetical protein
MPTSGGTVQENPGFVVFGVVVPPAGAFQLFDAGPCVFGGIGRARVYSSFECMGVSSCGTDRAHDCWMSCATVSGNELDGLITSAPRPEPARPAPADDSTPRRRPGRISFSGAAFPR